MKTQVCFIGHSHIAGTFYESKGDVAYSSLSAIKIKPDHKYIINIGSVGQPRDGDPRGSYCIYDDEKNTVEIKRVDYDIKKAKDKILKSKLPGILGERLLEGR